MKPTITQKYQWALAESSAEDLAIAETLSQALDISPVVCKLLVARGLRDIDKARGYLYPNLLDLHDPYLMLGMERAATRLSEAIDTNSPIMIYGDYDVDGTTSVSLVVRALREVFGHRKLHYYIPNRNDEGYGISRRAILETQRLGGDLIVSLDCGVKAIEEIDYAHSLGIDFIICDHHEPDDVLPRAYAILDPKQPNCTYPCKDLSGCGVGYKLMQALAMKRGIDHRKLYTYLDLLAISIAADIVPLVGENRILLYHGLKQLNSHPSLGVRAIMKTAGLEGKSKDLGSIIYHIAPRINASGRLMNGADAVALLTAGDESSAQDASERLDEYNRQRRTLDQTITEEAERLLLDLGDKLEETKILILYQPDWHKGVLGIVASRITERYHRPTLILTRSGKHVIGSGRSMRSVNLYTAIEACRHLLVNFGGHKHAAGLTIEEENIPAFKEALETYFEQNISMDRLVPRVQVDAVLGIDEISPKLRDEIALMAPFGLKNERPLFATYRLRDAGGSKVVGKHLQHLKLRMTDRYCKHRPLNGIALGLAEYAPWILRQQSFGICYTIEENTFYDKSFMQLNVKDIYTQGAPLDKT